MSERNLIHAENVLHETTYGCVPSVVYAENDEGEHGNFLRASYRRIRANPEWDRRLRKAYTASARVPRSADRQRFELDCCTSSDALLMNIFCYPRVLSRAPLCSLLGLRAGEHPSFGVRALLPMKAKGIDRTEIDMKVGDLLCEAKMTETGFQSAPLSRLLRYDGVHEAFALEDLPRSADGALLGYQLIRGALAARAHGGRFALLADGRRTDLREMWFRVLRAVRSHDLRTRLLLLSWQELAGTLPATVQRFLLGKYGIEPNGSVSY